MEAGEIKHLKTLKASEDRPLGRGELSTNFAGSVVQEKPWAYPVKRHLAGLPLLGKGLRKHIFAKVQTLSWWPSQRRGGPDCQSPRKALLDRDLICIIPLKTSFA